MPKTITLDPFTATFYSMYSEQRDAGESPKDQNEFGFIAFIRDSFGQDTVKKLEAMYQKEKKGKAKMMIHQPAYTVPLRRK